MNSSESFAELGALINLIDEPDETIYLKIKERIISYENKAIPFLEDALEHNLNQLPQKRIKILLHKLRFDNVCVELSNWYLLGGANLFVACMIIAKYQYPHLDENAIKEDLEKIKRDVWLEFNLDLTALEKVRLINHILFDVYKFMGDRANFHAPVNSYLNTVMESRRGNPLSLAIVYLLVANLLEIPIYGVNLPEHFVLAYVDRHSDIHMSTPEKSNVLFYINPFSGGTTFSRGEIDEFLKQIKIEASPNFYMPCSNMDIIRRLLNNLIFAYDSTGNKLKAEELKMLLAILK